MFITFMNLKVIGQICDTTEKKERINIFYWSNYKIPSCMSQWLVLMTRKVVNVPEDIHRNFGNLIHFQIVRLLVLLRPSVNVRPDRRKSETLTQKMNK